MEVEEEDQVGVGAAFRGIVLASVAVGSVSGAASIRGSGYVFFGAVEHALFPPASVGRQRLPMVELGQMAAAVQLRLAPDGYEGFERRELGH